MTAPRPHIIEVQVGKPFQVQLPAAGLGGYIWEIEVGPGLSAMGAVSDPTTPSPPQPVPGQARQIAFCFKATSAGTHTLTATRRRPWEQTSAEVRYFEIQAQLD